MMKVDTRVHELGRPSLPIRFAKAWRRGYRYIVICEHAGYPRLSPGFSRMSFKALVSPCPLPDRAFGHLAPWVRLGSTVSSSRALPQFPFPSHSCPAPHQIFHLAQEASQKEIKSFSS